MLKKFLAVVLSIAMIAAMWTIPAAATSLSDTLLMNVDYSTGSREDQTGNYTFGDDSYTNGDELVMSDEIDRLVNVNDGFGYDVYTGSMNFCGYDTTNGLTIETYVKASSDNVGHNGVLFVEAGAASILGITYYNDGEDTGLEMRLWDGMTPRYGELMSNVSYNDDTWHHVVVTTNGATETLYIDGVNVCQVTRTTSIIGQVGLAYSANTLKLCNDFASEMAFFRIYQAAVSADQVATMYAVAVDPSSVTPEPTAEPTPAPLAVTSTLTGSAGATVLAINPSYTMEWVGDLTGTEGEITMINNGLFNLEISADNNIYAWEWATSSLAGVLTGTTTRGFTQVVLTIDGQTANYYVNGELAATTELGFDGDTAQWNGCGKKGNYNWAYQFSAGLATNVTVGTMNLYNRAATAEEVAALYAAAAPTPVPTATPEPTFADSKTYTSTLVSSKNADSIPYNSEFTLEAYANTTGLNDGYILYCSAWQIEQDTSDGKISAWLWGHTDNYITTVNSYSLNDYVHVVLTAKDGVISIYVNGVLDNSITVDYDPAAPGGFAANQFNLANIIRLAWTSSSPAFFSIYSMAATAEDVAALYAPYAPEPTPEPTPVPTAAPIDAENLERVFNVDMRNGVSAANETGMHAPLAGSQGEFACYEGTYYATKATLPSTNDYTYDGTYVNLDDGLGYTIEAYVYTDGSAQTSVIMNGFDDSYGWNTLQLVDGHIQWKNGSQSITSTDVLAAGLHHVVVACNAEGSSLYIDGVLNKAKTNNIQNPGIWIIQMCNTAPDTYGIALARVYKGVATADQAAEMYTIVTGLEPVAPATPEPTAAPTPEPTIAPLTATYTMAEGVANTTDAMPIDASFSYEWYGDLTGTEGEVTLLNMCLYQLEVSPDNQIYTWEFNSSPLTAGTVERAFAHVVLTVEGTAAKWYVNGTLVTEATLPAQGNNPTNAAFAAGNGDFNFAHKVNAGLKISKALGTLNIYNRAATADEVAALYAAAVPTPAPEPTATPVITMKDVTVVKPTKTTYNVGETVDTTGLALLLGEETVDPSTYTVELPTLDSVGIKTVKVITSFGFTKTFSVKVVEQTLQGIKIGTKPTKLQYFTNETLDTTGLVVQAVYYNPATGTKSLEEVEGYTVSAIDPSVTGVQTITVSYNGATTSFSVKVASVAIRGTQLLSKPSKTTYKVGDEFSTAGMSIKVLYTDGTYEVVNEGIEVVHSGTSEAGLFTAKVSIGGKTYSQFSYRVK